MSETSWSYSSYSAAVKCLRFHKLVYIDRIATTAPDSGDLLFGSALHSAINACLTGEDAEAVFNIYWDSYKEKEIDYGRFKWQELHDLGLNFVSKFSRLHAKKYQVTKAESRLHGVYKELRLDGMPDFIGIYNGRRSLRDFKSSGYNYAKEKQDTALQLYLYAYLAIKAEGFTPETLGYDVFNKGTGSIQTLTWDFDEKKMYSMLDDLVNYCKTIEAQDHWSKNPNSCMFGAIRCSMFDKCWKKENV